MSDVSLNNLLAHVDRLNALSKTMQGMPTDAQVDHGYADAVAELHEQIVAECWIVGNAQRVLAQASQTETLAHRLVQAIVADEKHPDGCDVTAGLFGTELTKLVVELADLEARAYAAEDQAEEANNTVGVLLASAESGYSPNTIYHVGTDETGRVIARGTRSTSDAHKDFHVMHAALEFSQAYRLRGVVFPEQQIGGLLVRPANEKPKTGNVLRNTPTELTVTANALYRVLNALAGPAHHIRELQATRGLPGDTNPIDTLAVEYQRWFIANKAEGAQS